VEDFVGAGSSLKQLSLSRVSEIQLSHPTTATVGEPAAEVVRRAEANGDTSVVVLDSRRRPVSWPTLRQVRRYDTIVAGDRETLVDLDERATLNDALDTMLTSSHGGAVVTGKRDQYLGVIDFDAVTEHMRAVERQLQDGSADGAGAAGGTA
jgi:osmoprotectant transport system ATP-binding protein